MAKQFTLGKSERLKSKKQTDQLFSEGKKFSLVPFRIFYTTNTLENARNQFGVGVSNKIFKKATDRNRIKRLVREAWRLQQHLLQSKLIIFFIYTSKELPEYKEVYDKVGATISKLNKVLLTNK
ncbi:ribonuclease P protein component [Chitinophagaceae bacterium IBVUCB2]|nr:ribonuclease P protein component [Chitinophagaceae bacterium IBVUCB2]